jgi:hypothetical protein
MAKGAEGAGGASWASAPGGAEAGSEKPAPILEAGDPKGRLYEALV